MSGLKQNGLGPTETGCGELTDDMLNRVLSEYRKQKFLQSIVGPCISFSLHAVMFVTAITMTSYLRHTVEPGITVNQVRLEECIFDEPEEIIEEIIEVEDEMSLVSNLLTSNPAMPLDDALKLDDTGHTDTPEPSDTVVDISEIEPVDSPLIYYSSAASGTPHSSDGESGGIMCHRSTCGCGRCRRMRTYGSPDSARRQQAVLKPALNWLARVQNPNGSWGSGSGWSSESGHSAHTGLAILVFLAQGHTPLSPLYGPTVQKALRWLATYGMQEDLSTITRKQHGAYSHGIATYALCEAYGLTRIPFLATAMENSIDTLIDGQMGNGGFGYAYTSGPRWDLSVAGWNIQAMKSAQLVGCQHTRLSSAILKSTDFLKQVAYSGHGQFGYAGTSPSPRPNMAGVGVLCLQLLEESPSQEVARGYEHIFEARLAEYERVAEAPEEWNTIAGRSLYGWYYDTQVIFNHQATRQSKKNWGRWRNAFEKALELSQNKEGYWQTDGKHGIGKATTDGRVLATCLCALQLEVFYRRLPTYGIKHSPEKASVTDPDIVAGVDDDHLIID